MLSKSLIMQTKLRLIEFRREPSAMYWVIFMPIFWMLVLGFAFSEDAVERYGVFLIEEGAEAAEAEIVAAISEEKMLQLSRGTLKESKRALVRGKASVLVSALPSLTYQFDPVNREAKIAARVLDEAIQRYRGQKKVVDAIIQPIKLPGRRYVDWLVPGLLGLSIMSTSLFGVGMTIVSNRKENLLKRFCTTPLPKYEYLCSHGLGRIVSLLIESATLLLAAWILFDFKVVGSFAAFALTAFLGMACFTAIAMLCAARTKSIPVISGMTNLLMILMVMTSGVFFAKTNYPDWIQPALNWIPLTALVDALRIVSLEAAGIVDIVHEMLVLSGYAALAMVVAIRRFVWYS